MNLDQSWILSLQKAVVKFYSGQDLGVPWEIDRPVDGDKVSLTFHSPSGEVINREEVLASFGVRLVCSISSSGLYDLASISGLASSLLLRNISVDEFCASPLREKIEIELFDFKNGYKQSLMEQVFTTRLRG